MVTAVIFDWDGTLADTKSAAVESFKRVLIEVGCEVSDAFIERRIGIGTRNTVEDALKHYKVTLDKETITELIKKKVRLQTKLFERVTLFKDAIALLEALHGKTKVALATMSSRTVIDKLLTEKRVAKYFEVVVTADDVLQPKPHPEIFLTAATELKVKPEECVTVEDSIFGVRAARMAGMRCIAVPSGAYTNEELLKETPDLLVESLSERGKILEFIFGRER
jgi:putative hydrolase of the HAD superfamily